MMLQQKVIDGGEVRRWHIDVDAMARCVRWTSRRPDMLARELELLGSAFPTLLGVLGQPLGEDRCWVEAAEPVLCPDCRDLLVFDRGIRCVACQQTIDPPEAAVVGLVGRIPTPIAGRPFVEPMRRRLEALDDTASAGWWRRALVEVEGREYLAPRYGLWFAQAWPNADPPVMVWPEYFQMLDIPPDHVYQADPYYRLCLYASWREQPACRVLQNRVVPRLLIDLMVSDLNAVGQLDHAMERLDVSLYQLYNMVGRREQTQRFADVYRELTGS